MSKSSFGISWLLVLAGCAAIIIGARFLDSGSLKAGAGNDDPEAAITTSLPRTLKLARQKQKSLETYNNKIPESALLEFYDLHTKHKMSSDSYRHLEALVKEHALVRIWRNASAAEDGAANVAHKTMIDEIQRLYPHEVLTNADVILFPHDSSLRIIIAEPASDYFRDTARHWKWIADVSEQEEQVDSSLKELDIYAAEELSEFLSVLAVGIAELAAAESENGEIDVSNLDSVFEKISNTKTDVVLERDSSVGFSKLVKQRLEESLPAVLFEDISASTGIDFIHRTKAEHAERRAILEVPLGIAGGGVAANDFNGDGRMDLYFAGDSGGALLQSGADGTFDNVTESTGLVVQDESRAGYFVDFDNDGDNDLFVTFVGAPNRLFENNGDGKFTDISERVGLLADQFVSHEAVWFDMNNDGLLDLYVANFGDWMNGKSPTLGRINDNAPPNRLYRQEIRNGQRSFVEVGAEMGVDDRGWTHCVGAYDFDHDGWLDLFSINDFGASLVYRNVEGSQFEEVSKEIHMDDIYNGMSFTLLDLHHDSNFSIYVSQIMKLIHRQRYRQPNEETPIVFDASKKDNLRVLVNNRLFTRAFESRFRDDHNYRIEPANLGWSWDVSGLDYENDADVDLLVLNGTESFTPSASQGDTDSSSHAAGRNFLTKFNYEQNVFFIQEEGYFYDWSARNPIAYFGNSRGSTFVDIDADGDLDVVIANYNGKPKVFRNQQNSGNNWIRLRLQGVKSNRNAVGAIVHLKFDESQRYGMVVSGSGFLSQDPYDLHFGLGQAKKVDSITIQWPSGRRQKLDDVEVNQIHSIVEPSADSDAG